MPVKRSICEKVVPIYHRFIPPKEIQPPRPYAQMLCTRRVAPVLPVPHQNFIQIDNLTKRYRTQREEMIMHHQQAGKWAKKVNQLRIDHNGTTLYTRIKKQEITQTRRMYRCCLLFDDATILIKISICINQGRSTIL